MARDSCRRKADVTYPLSLSSGVFLLSFVVSPKHKAWVDVRQDSWQGQVGIAGDGNCTARCSLSWVSARQIVAAAAVDAVHHSVGLALSWPC